MKYLSKEPFTIAVTDRPHKDRFLDRILDEQLVYVGTRRKRASKPHEYINGGVMCQLCGLDRQAPIHTQEKS